ncbi:GATA zinc finger domain containing 2A, partial [Cichlidogyrus casuarinus]
MLHAVVSATNEECHLTKNGSVKCSERKRLASDSDQQMRSKCIRKSEPYKMSACERSPTPPFIKKLENELKNEESILSVLVTLKDRQNSSKYTDDSSSTPPEPVKEQSNGHNSNEKLQKQIEKPNNSQKSTYSIDSMLSEAKQKPANMTNGVSSSSLADYHLLQSKEQSLTQKRIMLRKQRDKSLLSVPDLLPKHKPSEIFIPTVIANDFLISYGLENVFQQIFAHQLKDLGMMDNFDLEDRNSPSKFCSSCGQSVSPVWISQKKLYLCEPCHKKSLFKQGSSKIEASVKEILQTSSTQESEIDKELAKVTSEVNKMMSDPAKAKLIKESKQSTAASEMEQMAALSRMFGSALQQDNLTQQQQEAVMLAMLSTSLLTQQQRGSTDPMSFLMNSLMQQSKQHQPQQSSPGDEEVLALLAAMCGAQQGSSSSSSQDAISQEQLAMLCAINPQLALYLMSASTKQKDSSKRNASHSSEELALLELQRLMQQQAPKPDPKLQQQQLMQKQ